MNFVYAKICDRLDWEDLVLYDSEEDAIKASIESPNIRIEKFIRSNNKFVPTYNYYKNGIFILTDNNPILERSEEQSDPPSLQTNSGETIQQFTEQTDIVSSVFDKIPPRIKRQTNDVPIKLGKLYYEIDKEYLLAGPGNIPDHITIYALIDSLKNEKIDELDIITGCKNVPTIWYLDENSKKHRHFVDIFIPSKNKCIEIKSTWTAKQNEHNIFLKQHAGKDLGYEYELWIYDSKGKRVEFYN
jgi:hypothetical protein